MTAKLRVVNTQGVFRLREFVPARHGQFSPRTRAILHSMPDRITQIKRDREDAAARLGEFVAHYKARHPDAGVAICAKGRIHLTTGPEGTRKNR